MAGNQNLVARIVINAQDNASKAFESIQANAGKLAAALVTTFAASVFKNAIDEAAQFELQLDKVAAKGGYTAQEMQTLTKAAQEIGSKFGVSGTAAAEGLEVLAAAGLKSSEAIAALPNVLKLAKSENISMNDSAELVANTVSTMGLKFEDSARIAGVFAKAANLSTVSAKDLGEAFKNVGLIASNSHYTLEQTAAMMDVLAKNGLKGGAAGTALAASIKEIENPASTASKALKAAGIESTNLTVVMEALHGKSEKVRNGILQAFGDESRTAMIAFSREGKKGFDEFSKALNASGDAAGETAATMATNFEGAKGRLAATFSNLQVALGTPILKPLTDALDDLSGQFNTLLSSGVIDKVGQSLASAFKAGGEWAVEFVKKTDFTAIGENIKTFAINITATFDEIGSKARDAGNVVNLVTGVFSAGFNTIQAAAAILEAGITATFGGMNKIIGQVATGWGEIFLLIPGFEKVGSSLKGMGSYMTESGNAAITFAKNLKDEAGKQLEEAGKSANKVQTAFTELADSAKDSTPKLDKIWQVSNRISDALNGTKTATDNVTQANNTLAISSDSLTKKTEEHASKIYKTVDALGNISYSTQQFSGSTEVAIAKTSGLINTLDGVKDKKTTVTADTKQPEDKISELKKDTSSKHEVKPENKAVDDAVAENKKDTSSQHTIESDASKPFNDIAQIETPTSHLHTIGVDGSAPNDEIDYIKQDTSSIHTIYVRTEQQAQNGGQIQHFATGGQPKFVRREGGLGGYGGGDTVPAMLEPGEWIIKKESVQKYGNGFMAQLNAGQINGIPKFSTGGQIDYNDSSVRQQYLNQAKNTEANAQYEVNRMTRNYNSEIEANGFYGLTERTLDMKTKAEKALEAAKKATADEQAKYDASVIYSKAKQDEAEKAQQEAEKAAKAKQEAADKAQQEADKAAKAKQDAADKQANDLYKQKEDGFKLSGNDTGLENLQYDKQKTDLSGNSAALAEAEKNHQLKLANIKQKESDKAQQEADKAEKAKQNAADKAQQEAEKAEKAKQNAADKAQQEAEKAAKAKQDAADKAQQEAEKAAKAKQDAADKAQQEAEKAAKAQQDAADKAQQESEKRQSQIDSLKDEVDGSNGNQAAIENRRYQKQQKELAGNSEALALAKKAHDKKVAAINAEKQKAQQTEQTQSATSNQTATTSSNQAQQNNSENIVITFKLPTGREAQGSFARADATTVVEILKEAANRGMPATFN
jgi:TP901 family phage tail tape measure protein